MHQREYRRAPDTSRIVLRSGTRINATAELLVPRQLPKSITGGSVGAFIAVFWVREGDELIVEVDS
jgi:hypothetical protein